MTRLYGIAPGHPALARMTANEFGWDTATAERWLARQFGPSVDQPSNDPNLPRCVNCNRTGIALVAGRCTRCRTEGDNTRQQPEPATVAPEKRANAAEYDRDGKWMFAGVLDELKADKLGAELGPKFNHDPERLAAHLGLVIQRVNRAKLHASSGTPITGWLIPPLNLIQVADDLSAVEYAKTIAHECGHAHGIGMETDRNAERFALAFLARPEPELPGAAWRKMQAEIDAQARRAATW